MRYLRSSKSQIFAFVASGFVSIMAYTPEAAWSIEDRNCVKLKDVTEYPFNADSIWNTPIGDRAKYQLPYDANETAVIRNPNPFPSGTRPHAYLWLGRNSMTVYHANYFDQEVRLTYSARPQYLPWPYNDRGDAKGGGAVKTRVPRDFVGRTIDGWAILFDTTNRFYLETWQPDIVRNSAGSITGIHSKFIARNDACSTGYPNDSKAPWRHDGIRAPGFSLLGGLVRTKELQRGLVPHAIAMVISQWQQKRASLPGKQYVWPALHADGDAVSNYRGVIAMGSLFAIPWGVNLDSIGLRTTAGKTIARAFQEYGGYVVDTATNTLILVSLESSTPKQLADDIEQDLAIIRNNLSLVENNSQAAEKAGKDADLANPKPAGGGGKPRITRTIN